MTPAFGFSVGDFVAAINLVLKVSHALRESDGASAEIRSLLQELHQLHVVLEQLRNLPPESSPTLSHLNALRGMALTVQVPLLEFLGKMEKYKIAAQKNQKSSGWKGSRRKIEWAVLMQEDVVRLRAAVTMKSVTVSLLMTIPTGQTLFHIKQSTVENRKAIETSRKDFQEAKEKLSKDILETRLQIKSSERSVTLDTTRLLKICVGLRVDLKRLERAQGLVHARAHRPQDMKILQTVSTANAQLQTSVDSLKVSISLFNAAVRQLLQSFSSFSRDVIEHLKQLQSLSNMETYLLLRRILENIPKQPSGLLADDMKFVDVLQREWRLPYTIFCDYEIFERMLQCKFKGFPGESKVRMGDYFIMNAKPPYQIINRQEWSREIFPGSSIDMSMLLLALRSRSDRCPQPNCCGIGELDIRSQLFVCSTCKLQYFPIMPESPVEALARDLDRIALPSMSETPVPNLRILERTNPRDSPIQERLSFPASPTHDQQTDHQSENDIDVNSIREDERTREIDELRVFRKVHFRAIEERQQIVRSNEDETDTDDAGSDGEQIVQLNDDDEWVDQWDKMAYQSSKSIGLKRGRPRKLFGQ